MSDRTRGPRVLELPEAAELLGLPAEGVEALVGAGYLKPAGSGPAGPRFALGDLKAFLARNADEGDVDLFAEATQIIDPKALLDALDGRADEMARRAYDIFTGAFPDAAGWSLSEQARFIDQAKKRFEAILAVTSQGEEVDEALVGDLEAVGASAAWAGSPLPQLLVILRISRDLVVQTAVEVAEEHGRHWGLALSLLLTRVLPAMDRLTDALAQGYWGAVVGRQEESQARYAHVVERASDGIYEVDLDGRIRYANQSLALILGHQRESLDDMVLGDVLVPIDARDARSLEQLTSEPEGGSARLRLTVRRADGVRRVLDIHTVARREEGQVVGYDGVVRDITAAEELEASKNQFLALITHDLRNPLTTILGLGVTLETYADELPTERVRRMGASIRGQSERISRLADDLYDMSRLEARSLVLNLRPVDVAATVEVALASVVQSADVEVSVDDGLAALADPRRLEQVVANLVENGLVHGRAPVVVEGRARDSGSVELSVRDHGAGVPEGLVSTLFSRVTLGRTDRDRRLGTGLGLWLVRGLIEAMGGRVWYEPADDGGACFRLVLPAPTPR